MFIILLLTWLVLGQFVMTGETIGSCFNNIQLVNCGGFLRDHTTCMQQDRVSYVAASYVISTG